MSLLCDNCYSKAHSVAAKPAEASERRPTQEPSVERAPLSPAEDAAAAIAPDTLDYIPDDDGYCQIDEIRLPAIVKAATTSTPSKNADKPQSKGDHRGPSSPKIVSITDFASRFAGDEAEGHDADEQYETLARDERHEEESIEKTDTLSTDGGGKKSAKANNNAINDNNTNNNNNINTNSSPNDDNNNDDNNNNSNNNSSDNNIEKSTDDDDICNTIENSATELNACGADHSKHAQTMLPVVPCHLISAYVSALNLQISQLLVSQLDLLLLSVDRSLTPSMCLSLQPKLSERDTEREKLRKENQQLKDLLDSMREHAQVSSNKVRLQALESSRPQINH